MKDDQIYLAHMREAVERILAYGSAGEAVFRQDLKTQDAVIRNLQVLGESD